MNQEHPDSSRTEDYEILSPGQSVSHYRIEGLIGAGGMGAVYLAHDTRLDRKVALKFLSQAYSHQSDFGDRFQQEARAAARLNHRNIVTIFELGEADDRFFIAMEYIEAESLDRRLRANRFTLDEALDVVVQICDGLQAAHSAGIIHRDLKPGNVVLDKTGRAVIVDFGLARLTQGSDATQTGRVMGTVNYMSPEQILNSPVDHRSDIFSLGSLFYELLCGTQAFSSDYYMGTLYSIIHHEPRALEEINPDIPPEIIHIVSTCLCKDPDDRFQDCREVASAIQTARKSLETSKGTIPATKTSSDTETAVMGRRDTIFVGRRDVLGKLRREAADVAGGQGRAVVITGEAGVGKSRLASKFAADFKVDRGSVFYGACSSVEGGMPYRPFVKAFKSGLGAFDNNVLRFVSRRETSSHQLTSGQVHIIASLLNVSDAPLQLQNKEQIWEALYNLCGLLTKDRPGLLVIDDLQWADSTTIEFFSFLARNIAPLPLLLLGIFREEETRPIPESATFRPWQVILQAEADGVLRIERLSRLSREETGRLIREHTIGGDVSGVDSGDIYERSAGNPLFVVELLNLASGREQSEGSTYDEKDGERALTNRIRHRIQHRLEPLDPAQREILEFASCQGVTFRSDIIAACLKLDRLPLLKQLQMLSARWGVIKPTQDQYQFDHPLMAEALYEGMLAELRHEYHRMIADWYLNEHSADESQALSIAYHLRRGGRSREAVPFLLRAGNRARTLYAEDEAEQCYRDALEIARSADDADTDCIADSLLGLGETCVVQGKAEEARELFEELVTIARNTGDSELLSRALRRLGDAEKIVGGLERSIELIQEALEHAGALNSDRLAMEALLSLGQVHQVHASDLSMAEDFLKRALNLAVQLNDPAAEALGRTRIGSIALHQGKLQAAVDQLDRAIAAQESLHDSRGMAESLNMAGLVHRLLGNFDTALESLTRARGIMEKIGFARGIAGCINGIGDTYRDVFRLDEAIAHHTKALELSRKLQNKNAQCDNLRDLGVDYFLQGSFEKAQQRLQDCLELSRQIGNRWYETRSQITLAQLLANRGEAAQADQLSIDAMEQAVAIGSEELKIEARRSRAHALIAGSTGTPAADAVELLIEALASANTGGYRPLVWQLQADLGKHFDQTGRSDEAGRQFAAARETIENIAGDISDDVARQSFLSSPAVKEVTDRSTR